MMRITLNVILRAVFGAEDQELERLREILPPAIRLGSKLALIPVPQWDWGRWSPWGRFFQYRREYDAVVQQLIDKALADPVLGDRDDVLALMLRSRYGDGSSMTRAEIADELITMLAAGHETTATTLAWAVERLQRHSQLLDRLVRRDGIDVSVDELRALVKGRKGAVYAPKRVEFVEALATTGLGKVDKKALRAPYWEGRGRR